MQATDKNFADWERSVFGFGYGTGEPYVLGALRAFMETVNYAPLYGSEIYDYTEMEGRLTKTAAWLLINALCRAEIIDYGSSPRFGWLSEEGKALRDFALQRTTEELVAICERPWDPGEICYPDTCNCGLTVDGVKCPNPFWPRHH